ncbi:MAG: HTH domain-containing protein [Candidatus Stahlbacteria bacterium]|nr:MAG: HTH domain-containing protein [Candidatus Stahlbacteria bacterium]
MKEGRSLNKAKATGGFTWVANRFIDGFLPLLSGLAFKVYVYLARNAPQSQSYDPITRKGLSASKIGEVLHRSRRSISKSLNELEKWGLIEKIKTPGLCNRYRLLATCKENLPGDDKKTLQGSKENLTPPVKKTLQGNTAKPYEPRADGSPKSILRGSKSIKEVSKSGLRPIQQPSGCGPRKI